MPKEGRVNQADTIPLRPAEVPLREEKDATTMETDAGRDPAHAEAKAGRETPTILRVAVPSHRYTPLRKAWMEIYKPVTEQMGVDMRMNLRSRRVELRHKKESNDPVAGGNLQKCADFVNAFILGFEVQDAIALLRLDDLYIERFEIKDVKQTLKGEHLSRAIGRISGKNGKTKFTIENTTRTRIVLADTHISILGTFQNIRVARDAICGLILGSPPGKVYSRMRTIAARVSEQT